MREVAVPNMVNDVVMFKNLMTIVHSPADHTYTGHYCDACYAANIRKVYSITVLQNGLNIG